MRKKSLISVLFILVLVVLGYLYTEYTLTEEANYTEEEFYTPHAVPPEIHVDDLYHDLVYLDNIFAIFAKILPDDPDPFYDPPSVNATKWEICYFGNDFFRMVCTAQF